MAILSVHVQITNVSKVFSEISKILVWETIYLFYINAIFTIHTLTHYPHAQSDG